MDDGLPTYIVVTNQHSSTGAPLFPAFWKYVICEVDADGVYEPIASTDHRSDAVLIRDRLNQGKDTT